MPSHDLTRPRTASHDPRVLKVHACNIYGRINRSVLPYLLSIHVMPKRVFLLMLKVASVGRGCGRGAVE
eukprot:3299203-Prymnesium_polylepis.1